MGSEAGEPFRFVSRARRPRRRWRSRRPWPEPQQSAAARPILDRHPHDPRPLASLRELRYPDVVESSSPARSAAARTRIATNRASSVCASRKWYPPRQLRPLQHRELLEELGRVEVAVFPLAGHDVVDREAQPEHPWGGVVPLEVGQVESPAARPGPRRCGEASSLSCTETRVSRSLACRRYRRPPCTSLLDLLEVPEAKSPPSSSSALSPRREAPPPGLRPR